jgi:hypothetical protein
VGSNDWLATTTRKTTGARRLRNAGPSLWVRRSSTPSGVNETRGDRSTWGWARSSCETRESVEHP